MPPQYSGQAPVHCHIQQHKDTKGTHSRTHSPVTRQATSVAQAGKKHCEYLGGVYGTVRRKCVSGNAYNAVQSQETGRLAVCKKDINVFTLSPPILQVETRGKGRGRAGTSVDQMELVVNLDAAGADALRRGYFTNYWGLDGLRMIWSPGNLV
ncbi:hypothetical protein B0H13DRAFT_1871777 [Mycena leptocephala]|nr:hypothetical protein B0H13DRAFT_1871777 [Mycena leptocephala]